MDWFICIRCRNEFVVGKVWQLVRENTLFLIFPRSTSFIFSAWCGGCNAILLDAQYWKLWIFSLLCFFLIILFKIPLWEEVLMLEAWKYWIYVSVKIWRWPQSSVRAWFLTWKGNIFWDSLLFQSIYWKGQCMIILFSRMFSTILHGQ